MTTNVSARYETVISQARKAVATWEAADQKASDAGWKMAEWVHEAVMALRDKGMIFNSKAGGDSACARVARDLERSTSRIKTLYCVYKRYPPEKRMENCTFNDHVRIYQQPSHAEDIKAMRAAGRGKSVNVNAAGDPYYRLRIARNEAKKAARANVWDFPDRDLALKLAWEATEELQGLVIRLGNR